MTSSTTQQAHQSATPAPPIDPRLTRFVDQWAVLLTSRRRDGTTVGTPVNICVEGDHAFMRTYHRAHKMRRMLRDPIVAIAPCTWRGRRTGPALQCSSHLLESDAAERAGRLIDRKYPIFQRLLVRTAHRVRGYQTLHFRLRPLSL